MKLTELNVLFAPVSAFPKVEGGTSRVVVQIEIDHTDDGDTHGTIAANLGATSVEDAKSLKQLLGLVLHRISHDLLSGTVFDTQLTEHTSPDGAP